MDHTLGAYSFVADRPVASPYTPEYQALVEVLRAVREEAGIAHHELSKRLQESRMYIYKVETLRRRVDPAEVRRIAIALQLDPGELFSRWLKLVEGSRW